MFKVPLKYGDQIVLVAIENDGYWSYLVGTVSNDRNIDNVKVSMINGRELAKMLENPKAIGSQMLIQMDAVPLGDSFAEKNERILKMFELMEQGDVSSGEMFSIPNSPECGILLEGSILY